MSRDVVKSFESGRFQFDLEDMEGFLFVHVMRWEPSLSAVKEARKLIPEALEWAEKNGYDGIHGYTQNAKLAKIMKGFEFIQNIYDDEGNEWGFYKCHKQ